MKVAPIVNALKQRGHTDWFLVHTGQHYDAALSQVFFTELGLPEPDVWLGVGSGSHADQTARVMTGFEKVCLERRPNIVLVVGDVNSTMAATIVAAKLCIPVAHVEAGLRSGDRAMPEEINRLVTDALTDYCFTTSPDADENLRRYGVPDKKIFFVGYVMSDPLQACYEAAPKSDVRSGEKYGFVTLHRPSNVDSKEVLTEILSALKVIQEELPLIFPVHPRTAGRMKEFGFWNEISQWKNLRLTEPLGYLDSLCLLAGATMVLTDSGGVQEETTVLGVPCLTIRNNTERPVTITEGTNRLVGTSHVKIVGEARKILAGEGKRGRVPKYWDGRAAERIVQCLLDHPPKG